MKKTQNDFYTVDAHCDSVRLFSEKYYSFAGHNALGHIDLPRLREGGVNLQFFALFVEPEYRAEKALQRAVQLLEIFWREMDNNKDYLTVIKTKKDLSLAVKVKDLSVLLSLEGGEPLSGGEEFLYFFYRLGVRSIGLTWNNSNCFAGGVAAGESAGGITALGRDLIRKMNRLGIVVDGAHLAPKSYFDLLDIAEKPVLVSHANAFSLCSHPRNLTDDQLRALRDKGGVVGLTFYPPFISEKEPANLDKLLDHFCYIADLAGTEVLGLGSDFDGIDQVLPELPDVSCLPSLKEGLRARGFTEKELSAILGGNIVDLLLQNLPDSDIK
ncbi:MAG TPA: membrane dipeptidase [Firmicutes bacterium]|jgi:membrane dipeptidase|nr:membrane dipeptidase [Bacillota bacterium]